MSHVQDGSVAQGGNTGSLTASIAGVTANNLLVCTVAWYSATTAAIATPTGWSLGYSSAGHGTAGNGYAGTAVFFKGGASAGANSCAMTLPDGSSSAQAVISEFSGYTAPVSVNVTAVNAGGNNIVSQSVGPTATTTVANTLVIYNFSTNENDPGTGALAISTPGAGTTNAMLSNSDVAGIGRGIGCTSDWKERTSTGTESATWTWSPSNQGVDMADGTIVILAGTSGGNSVTPGAGALTLTGFAPTIAQPHAVNPGVGTLTLTGFAPTIAQPQTASPGVGTLTLTGFAPTVGQGQSASPGVGTISLTGFAPNIAQTANQSVVPGVRNISITGFAPTLVQTGAPKNTPGRKYQRLPRMVWKTRPEPVIVKKDPAKSEITPEIKRVRSTIKEDLAKARARPRVNREEDEDDILLLLS